jgi:hypothetical protein
LLVFLLVLSKDMLVTSTFVRFETSQAEDEVQDLLWHPFRNSMGERGNLRESAHWNHVAGHSLALLDPNENGLYAFIRVKS